MVKDTTILLVDDEPLVSRSMEKTLLRAGFAVDPAGSAKAGLTRFEEALADGSGYDLAILDLHMPNLAGEEDPEAGLELLSALRKRAPGLPVIVLTAFDDVRRAKEAISRGARAYFVKGRELNLIELVESIIESE